MRESLNVGVGRDGFGRVCDVHTLGFFDPRSVERFIAHLRSGEFGVS